MATVRRNCGSVMVKKREQTSGSRRKSGSESKESTDTSSQSPPPTPSEPPRIAGIGPLTADNPRALAAGGLGAGLLLVALSGG